MKIPLRLLRSLVPILAGLLVVGACSGNGAGSDSTTANSDDIAVTSVPVVTILSSDDPVDADVPAEYLDAVLSEVATLSGIPQEDFTVLDSTAVEWADQRLGCVHFAEPSDPMPIDGYRVVVDTGEAQFDYRLDDAGTSYLCGDPIENSGKQPDEGDDGEIEDAPQ